VKGRTFEAYHQLEEGQEKLKVGKEERPGPILTRSKRRYPAIVHFLRKEKGRKNTNPSEKRMRKKKNKRREGREVRGGPFLLKRKISVYTAKKKKKSVKIATCQSQAHGLTGEGGEGKDDSGGHTSECTGEKKD